MDSCYAWKRRRVKETILQKYENKYENRPKEKELFCRKTNVKSHMCIWTVQDPLKQSKHFHIRRTLQVPDVYSTRIIA